MRHIVVTFDLATPEPDHYRKAYETFVSVGLHPVAKGVVLPTTTLLGAWYDDAVSLPDIRTTLIHGLIRAGVKPSALLVASFEDAAWWGDPVKRSKH